MVARAAEDFDAFYAARRAAAGEPVADESVVVLTFDGKGVVLHHEDLREATRKAAERRRQQREPLSVFNRLQPGEKKHAKRMATVAAVYAVAPFVRSPEEFLQSLMPRQPAAKAKARNRAKTAAVRPRPAAKRAWASLEHEPAEVVAEAMLEAERHDPERVKRWVVLVDGAETQLDLVEAGAAAYGVDVTVILDIIHVVEYVWKAAHVFHDEGSPELACWAWTRVRDILEGKARRVAAAMRRAATVAGLSRDTRKPVDTCADYLLKYAPYLHYDRYLAAGYPIATGVITDAGSTHTSLRSFRKHSPPLAVVPNQDPRRDCCFAGHQAPRFVHLRVVYADVRRQLLLPVDDNNSCRLRGSGNRYRGG